MATIARDLRERANDPAHREALCKGFNRLAETRKTLDEALRLVAERRSGVRLALGASELPEGFLNVSSDQRFVMRLGRLTREETLRWVRRNLPGLLRYGETRLERMWPRMGASLDRWEELERRILASKSDDPNLEEILNVVAPGQDTNRRPGSGTGLPGAWFVGSESRRRRGERPLRVAVAGPFIAERRGNGARPYAAGGRAWRGWSGCQRPRDPKAGRLPC